MKGKQIPIEVRQKIIKAYEEGVEISDITRMFGLGKEMAFKLISYHCELKRYLYEISLCKAGETHVFYRYARTKEQALQCGIRGIEKCLGYTRGSLKAEFMSEEKDNKKIRRIKDEPEQM